MEKIEIMHTSHSPEALYRNVYENHIAAEASAVLKARNVYCRRKTQTLV